MSFATTRDYTNFVVRLKIADRHERLHQFRLPDPFAARAGYSEMAGYQCDFGEPNWYGAVYDESRRNKLMAPSDMKALRP
jgi:hypothetical protein